MWYTFKKSNFAKLLPAVLATGYISSHIFAGDRLNCKSMGTPPLCSHSNHSFACSRRRIFSASISEIWRNHLFAEMHCQYLLVAYFAANAVCKFCTSLNFQFHCRFLFLRIVITNYCKGRVIFCQARIRNSLWFLPKIHAWQGQISTLYYKEYPAKSFKFSPVRRARWGGNMMFIEYVYPFLPRDGRFLLHFFKLLSVVSQKGSWYDEPTR
jgi:hypothetical protein